MSDYPQHHKNMMEILSRKELPKAQIAETFLRLSKRSAIHFAHIAQETIDMPQKMNEHELRAADLDELSIPELKQLHAFLKQDRAPIDEQIAAVGLVWTNKQLQLEVREDFELDCSLVVTLSFKPYVAPIVFMFFDYHPSVSIRVGDVIKLSFAIKQNSLDNYFQIGITHEVRGVSDITDITSQIPKSVPLSILLEMRDAYLATIIEEKKNND